MQTMKQKSVFWHSKKGGNFYDTTQDFLRHDEVKEFVKRASACDFDIDISYNHYTVDAKSILGVLALDFRQALTVCCHGYDEGFEKYLGKYAMAC